MVLSLLAAVVLASPLTVADVHGKQLTVLDPKKTECFFFILSECPVANAYAPEINRITKEYGKRGVSFYLVHGDSVTASAASKHAKDFGYSMPVLMDPKHALLKRVDARRSPEAVLVRHGEIVYQGRIDDLYSSWGVKRSKPKSRELRDALNATLAGKPVKIKRTEAVGCIFPR